MNIEWSKSLATGVEWQDKQHKELFHRINSLLSAMDAGLGKDELKRFFNFLDEYFVIHFEAEERMMHKYNYPGTLAHLAQHTGFIEDTARLRDEFRTGPSSGTVIKFLRQVVDWLLNHIGHDDKALGAFILEEDEKKKK